MNIQRFHAPTAREALALARAAFGDDTLILSNRQVGDGVEVMAATEQGLAPASAGASFAPAAPVALAAPAARPEAGRGASQPLPYALVATSGATTEEVVKADVEQLAMSTLSFQDYVRERMLRRQTEAAASSPAQPHAPVPASQPPVQAATPARANAFAAPAAPVAPLAPLAPTVPVISVTSFASVTPAASTPAATSVAPDAPVIVPAEAVTPQPAAPAVGTDATRVLMAELDAMKRLMEERFNTLSWLSQARRDPVHSNLMLKLVRAGYSPALAREVLEPLSPTYAHAGDAMNAVTRALEQRLGLDPYAPSMVEEGGVFALIGATGVGKTTTVAKLASRCASEYGAGSVGLVTLDIQRAGAHEQLRALGRSLGVVAHLAHDRDELREMLSLLGGKRMVLVDTAGIAPRDPQRGSLLDLLDVPGIKRVLVLNAGAHGDTLDDIATAFTADGTREAVLSKIDEAAKIAPALDTLMRHRLRLRGVADGQRVPDDWQAADAGALVALSMRAGQRSPFDPEVADMDFYYSPAACAL